MTLCGMLNKSVARAYFMLSSAISNNLVVKCRRKCRPGNHILLNKVAATFLHTIKSLKEVCRLNIGAKLNVFE